MSKDKKVSYTDYGRSGVMYTDAEGNPVSKEEMYADELPEAPVESILEEESIRYIKGKKDGGMNGCPYRRKGAKSGIQGIKDIQVQGGKFIGCK